MAVIHVGVIKNYLKIEIHNNAVRLLFGRIVTSLFEFLYFQHGIGEFKWFSFFPSIFELISSAEMFRFAYSIAFQVLPKYVRVLCWEFAGNLSGIDKRNFPLHSGEFIL